MLNVIVFCVFHEHDYDTFQFQYIHKHAANRADAIQRAQFIVYFVVYYFRRNFLWKDIIIITVHLCYCVCP